MRPLLSTLAFAALATVFFGCGTKTPLSLPPAPTATPQPAQPSSGHHSNTPETAQ